MAKFSELLSELRQEAGLTQRELARALHLGNSTISNYETGAHYPDIEKICLFADYFDVSVDYLLGRSKVSVPIAQFRERIEQDTDYRVEEFVQDVLSLPPELKQAVLKIVSNLKLVSVLNQYRREEKT